MSEIPSPALIAALHMAIRYVEQVAATPQAAAARPLSPRAAIRDLKRIRTVLDEGVNQKVKPQHRLAVWYGSLPESNGKKAAAIEQIWRERSKLLAGYTAAEDKLAFLENLPWIGSITKFHLAKNFGVQVAKPDVHIQRMADREGCTAQELCERLAASTGYRVATIDTILWRAAANGLLNSKTGAFLVT